jgi:lysophospholipase L1-like esterase
MKRLASLVAVVVTAVGFVSAPGSAAVDPLDVMPLGDSITRGQGDPFWNGYRADLRARMARAGLNPNFVGPWSDGGEDNSHGGTSGARIDQIAVQIPQLMADYRPDVVLLMVGTNDVGQKYELHSAKGRMSGLIARIRKFRPSARVFVGEIPQFRDAAYKPYVDQLNAAIRAAVLEARDPMVSLVPNRIVGTTPTVELVDQVHLTRCGYARIAYLWWYYMNRSNLNRTPGSWSAGYWPWGTAPGACQS